MSTLYWLFTVMLFAAFCILAIPFLQNSKSKFSSYLIMTVFLALFSMTAYQFSGNKIAIQQWLAEGKQHYQLQEKFIAMGGVDGIIARIQKKLETNPTDWQGWFIVGKLYLNKNNYAAALTALTKAHDLQPDNKEITNSYQLAVEKGNSHEK